QNAAIALRIVLGRWRGAGVIEGVHSLGKRLGLRAQIAVEVDLGAAARLAVEDRAPRHLHTDHFLQAQSLRAQLHFVAAVRLRTTALILDRERARRTLRLGAELHHVRDAGQA